MVDVLTERVNYPPRWYLGFVAVAFGVAVMSLVVGLFGLYQNDRSAANQAECFSAFAARLSTVSKEVRAATVATDEVEAEADKAAADRDAAFQDVLTFILAQSDNQTEGLRLFTKLTDANADLVDRRQALVKARNNLAVVREEHPIPDPPSESGCDLLD